LTYTNQNNTSVNQLRKLNLAKVNVVRKVNNMKTFLVFNSEKDPYDRMKLKRALTADDAYLVIWHLDMWFRRQFKYETLSKAKAAAFKEVSEELYRLLDEYELDLNNLE
jgi:hypothetical protein